MATRPQHTPVLLERVVELLALPAGPAVVVDATVGAAGHAAALLAASAADVHLVGVDRDPDALELAAERLRAFSNRVTLVRAPFDRLATAVGPVSAAAGPVRAVLYDLGVSSMQLDRPGRGFSFRAAGPLDMRMDRATATTAADLVNTLAAEDLADLVRRYGEERFAGRIARAIVAARPLTSTAELADVVRAAVPARARQPGHHPATRTFQALRIAVNRELERLSDSLPQALELLAPGGRIAVLTYHSLEDRIVKRFFSDAAAGCICPPGLPVCGCGRVPLVSPLVRGAERPSAHETAANPRARAAKLRAVQRTDDA